MKKDKTMKSLQMTFALCFLLLAWQNISTSLSAAERRTIEAEEFDGLKRYPYFRNKEPGWYAQEGTCRSYGAAGKGYFAMIHETAKNRVITKTLSRSIPAGKYLVFISSSGHYWYDQPEVVTIRVGGVASRIERRNGRDKFKWYQGTPITLDHPATRIEMEATQFGGKGFAQLYEPNERTIAVDRIYITSDLSEKTGPSIQGFHVITAGRDEAAAVIARYDRNIYRKVLVHDTPKPVTKPTFVPLALRSFDGRKNLWPNSSFELGGKDGWFTETNKMDAIHVFSEKDHIEGDAFQGSYFLRLPPAGNMPHMSRVMQLQKAGTYTLSAYVRQKPGSKSNVVKVAIRPIGKNNKLLNPVIVAQGKLTSKWQRIFATGKLGSGPVILAVYGACELDALQLEADDKVTAFAPRAAVEASLATNQLANIMYSDKPTTLTAWAHNSSNQPRTITLRYLIRDIREQVVAKGSLQMQTDPGKTVRRPLIIKPKLNGIFSAIYSSHSGMKTTPLLAEGEMIYSVLPPIPADMPRHALACNMEPIPEIYRLMARMGHKWQLYCKLKVDTPRFINPKPGEYRWDQTRRILTEAQKYGFRVMPCLWPGRSPKHLRDKELNSYDSYAGKRDITRQVKVLNPKRVPVTIHTFPDLEKWREYCKLLALNLGEQVPWWTIDDETEMYYSPREFARITRATIQGFEDSGKQMKVSHSCMGDYLEEMLAELGQDVKLGGIGSSSYNYEYWDARKVRYLQKRYNLPWSCIGVGSYPMPQFHHTLPGYAGVYAKTVRTAHEMIFLTLVQDAKVIGHYTGRMWMRGSLINTDYPLMDYDGTPLSHGFAYSCIPLLLANAKPVEDIFLDKLNTLVFVYRQGKKLSACTWANNTPDLDIHWKTEPRSWRRFTLPQAAGKVNVLGMFGNPRSDIETRGRDLVFHLDEEPVFIVNRDLTDAVFVSMLKSAHAKPRDLDMRLAFIPNGKSGVDLGVRIHNTTNKTCAGLKLDANFPPNRMLSRTSWMLPERRGKIGSVDAGKITWGRLSLNTTLDFPIENATFTTWLTDAQGREHAEYDTCWLTIAPQVTVSLDGKIEEWGKVQPAWMYYTYSWARFGRHTVQFVKNGEHFKYAWRTDARTAIYAGYDQQNLYIALQCEDDDLIKSGSEMDALEIKLNSQPGETSGTITIPLTFVGGKMKASENVRIAFTQKQANAYHVPTQDITIWSCEVAIPLSLLPGITARQGTAIGFDVIWHDADHDGNKVVTGIWRWAGRSSSLGSLFFR